MRPSRKIGDISAAGHPIHFMYGSSRVGFSGSVDWMALFSVLSNPIRRLAAFLKNFEWRYLRNGSYDPLHVWRRIELIYCRLNQIQKAAARHLGKFSMNVG